MERNINFAAYRKLVFNYGINMENSYLLLHLCPNKTDMNKTLIGSG